jgi:4-hydroxybenzoate polyprenyltransferase
MKKLRLILAMIKFEHTIFALPFAYLGMVLAANGLPGLYTFFWITAAMVGARSYAMAMNRLADRAIDSKNPRTKRWPLSQGAVTVLETGVFITCSVLLFVISAFMLPPLCHKLWPLVLIPMTVYPFTKRFTWASHLVLGLCLGLAPLAAWVAVTNAIPPAGIAALGLAVGLWTAGFDIIYSCQDYGFDRQEGLHSIPVRFGLATALTITRFLHAGTVLLLVLVGMSFSLGPVFFAGILLIAVFLWYENRIVSPTDLSRVTVSFFTLNGLVSICALFFTFLAVFLKR